MLKKIPKLLIMGVTLMFCMGMFTACKKDKDYAIDKFSISIKAEYKEEFLEQTFTASDFDWKNFDRIDYGTWQTTLDPEVGYCTIYLKKHGRKQVQDAIEHFSNLDFVSKAEPIGLAHMY